MTTEKPTLKLVGEDGNAFYIIGRTCRVGRRAGWTEEQITTMYKEAMSGNYDHVLQTMFKYFDVR